MLSICATEDVRPYFALLLIYFFMYYKKMLHPKETLLFLFYDKLNTYIISNHGSTSPHDMFRFLEMSLSYQLN